MKCKAAFPLGDQFVSGYEWEGEEAECQDETEHTRHYAIIERDAGNFGPWAYKTHRPFRVRVEWDDEKDNPNYGREAAQKEAEWTQKHPRPGRRALERGMWGPLA